MTPFTDHDQLVRMNERPGAELNGDLVLLDLPREEYQLFRGTARRLWDLLERPATVPALCTALMAEYEVPAERCRAEVVAFLTELHMLGLLQVRRADG